jgi:hypothetical protein
MEAEIDHIVRIWQWIKGGVPEHESDTRAALAEVLAGLPDDDPQALFIAGMKYLHRKTGSEKPGTQIQAIGHQEQ